MDGLVVKTPPTVEPLDLSELKDHIPLYGDDFDRQLRGTMIPASRAVCERQTGRQLITATWVQHASLFPRWGQAFILPLGSLQAVVEIRYSDAAGDPQVWDAADYIVDLTTEPAEVYPRRQKNWPATTGGVEVEFTCGYGADFTAVPADLRAGMMAFATHLFDNRSAVDASKVAEVPQSAGWIFEQYRLGDEFHRYNAWPTIGARVGG